ncbi:MAG: ATP-binding protein [Alphaproteobacteria bacterium]
MLDTPPRLLYIEDCEHLSELFRLIMIAHGYRVDIAHTGMDGLNMHKREPYDVVAVDYRLPDILGIEICNELLTHTPDLPVIMVTGQGSEDVAAEALDIGVANYIVKGGKDVYKRLIPSVIGKLVAEDMRKKERRESDRKARENEARFRDYYESSSDWHWETDENHCFTLLSGGAFERLGVNVRKIIGRRREEVVAAGENINDEKWRTHFGDLAARRAFRNLEFQILCDGKDYWVGVNGVPFFDADGKFLGYRGTATDISKRKLAEHDLWLAIENAEAANSSKSEFLAHMSHELRTPLNSVLGFSEMIREQIFGPLGNDKYIDYVNTIFNSGQHLLAIIDDILDISRIEAGKTELQENEFDPHHVLGSCVDMVSDGEVSQPRIELVASPLRKKFRGDERLFRQIVLNLLSNAKKFTKSEGSIRIEAMPDDENRLIVAVTDTGIGIAAEDLSKVLKPFGQARDSAEHAHAGAGLGLPLSKMLTELHGGTLELASEVSKGTTVTLRFPAERTLAA